MTDIDTEETWQLIAADKVEGTPVYNHEGNKLGAVDSIMLNKRTGKVAYAVMSFGGFLGIGEEFHPLPWDVLNYDTERDGYIVNLTKEQLEQAPRYAREDQTRLRDRQYEKKVFDYYAVPPYWI